MKRLRQGFTLVEVMIGMALTIGSSAALFALLTQTFNMIHPMRDYTRASLIAQSEIEKLRSMSETQIEAMSSNTVITVAENPAIGLLPDGEVVVFSQPYDALHPGTPIYAVSVEVSWSEKTGGRATSVLSSIVYSQGVGK